MGVSSVLANPYLELPAQNLTKEELLEMLPWYDTEVKPLDSMVLEEIALRELDESWLFITLTYRDEEEGATLDALLGKGATSGRSRFFARVGGFVTA